MATDTARCSLSLPPPYFRKFNFTLPAMNRAHVVALCLGIVAAVHPATADMFVRPSIMYVSYQNSGYSGETGFGLAAGANLGARAEHELGLEIATMDWSLDKIGYAGTPYFFRTIGSGRLVPCLANYRYRFDVKAGLVRLYLGASFGLANRRGDLTQYRSGVVAHASFSHWSTAYGGTAGLTVPLADKVELDLGYRYLYVASFEPGSGYNRIPTDDIRANLFQVALGWRF